MWLFPSVLRTKITYASLLSLIRARGLAHLILRDLITRIKFCADYTSWSPLTVQFPPITCRENKAVVCSGAHCASRWKLMPKPKTTHEILKVGQRITNFWWCCTFYNKLFEIRKQAYAVYRQFILHCLWQYQ
jgi:hypothetical protein